MSSRKPVLFMPVQGVAQVLAIKEFKELYSLVECDLLQLVMFQDDLGLWVDEEGLLKRPRKINRMASMLANTKIVGNAVLTRINTEAEINAEDEIVGLSDSFLLAYRDLLSWTRGTK